jgi:hypothetical protein
LPTSMRTMEGLERMQTLSLEPSINLILLLAAMQLHFSRESNVLLLSVQ